jgi:hypothetical protein
MDKQKIEDVLKSISSDILTEEVKTNLAKVFNEAVEEKANSQIQLVVENELSKMDEDHTAKLDKLIEAIDADHTSKFHKVIKQIDEAHSAKLKKIVEKYENDMKNGAESLRVDLIEKITKFLDLYIEDTLPKEQLKEACQNIRARTMLDEIRKIVAVDPEFISENFKSALKDGHDTIEKLRGELNKTIKEAAEIKNKLTNTEATLLLERKTKDLTDDKKKFVMKLLDGKNSTEIEKNFNYVVEMFNKDEAEKIEKETEKTVTKIDQKTFDTPKVIVEKKEENDAMNEYSYINDIAESMKKEESFTRK